MGVESKGATHERAWLLEHCGRHVWREGTQSGLLVQATIGVCRQLWRSSGQPGPSCRGQGPPPIHVSLLSRDDAFSDSLSQKADSEASSGPLLDDKASSKNDLQSPTEHISDYGFGGVMGR